MKWEVEGRVEGREEVKKGGEMREEGVERGKGKSGGGEGRGVEKRGVERK